jgi:RNA polymerase sigma factor (TIGR02999 family)
MSDPRPSPITLTLKAVSEGDALAAERLLPLVYDELRRVARLRMAAESPGITLQPTALVHEAYLRVMKGGDAGWDSRRHFFGAAAQAMRRILVDQARARRNEKRGGGTSKVAIHDLGEVDEPAARYEVPKGDLLAVDAAVAKLEAMDARKGRIVELRYFVGLTNRETAAALGISVSTVEQEWRYIRSWLQRELATP